MNRWHLYVDESGDFESRGSAVLVAGLLVREGMATECHEWLRGLLEKRVSWVPWPFHATYLRNPVMYALWSELLGHDHGYDELALVAPVVIRLLEERAAEALARARKALSRTAEGGPRRDPRYDDARALDNAVARDAPAERRKLLEIVGKTRERIAEVLRSLSCEEGDLETEAVLFCASESVTGDACPTEAKSPDRYMMLLECLIERVLDALLHRGGSYDVVVSALTRRIRNAVLGNLAELRLGDISQACSAAAGSTDRTLERGGARIRLVPGQPRTFDDSTHGGLVLADFLANHMRPGFARPRCLADLIGRVELFCSVPLRSGSPSLPHVPGSGAAREFLREVRGPGFEPTLMEGEELRKVRGINLWAIEQALAWAPQLAGGG